ncbi:MAG: hypothetical protein IKY59_05970, partial [Oscillospiraceae bacterium]|nr:hypothetical protein [Oscillospiraceae bacterium]
KDVSEFETLEELKADIRAKAQENAEKQAASAFEQACVEKVAENCTVEMPKALIEAELDNQMERFAYQLQMSGYSMDQYAKMMGGDMGTMRNAFRPAAEKQAKINVTLAKIVEVEGINVSEDEINAEIENLAKQYELEAEKIRQMIPTAEIEENLKTRKAVKVIVDNAVAVAPKAESCNTREPVEPLARFANPSKWNKFSIEWLKCFETLKGDFDHAFDSLCS